MLPLVEVVPLSILSNMSKHSCHEFLLEVSAVSPDLKLVQIKSKSSLHNAVKHSTNVARAECFVFSIAFFGTHYELLPVLECFRLIEILHPVEYL